MSFTDRVVLWLHVAFAIFAIGPVTIATMSSPRYIRTRNVGVLRYLLRITRIFWAVSLGVLVFGLVLAQQLDKLAQAWMTASMTLFVVALVMLVLVMRDQRRAIAALESAAENEALVAANSPPPLAGQRDTPPEAGRDAGEPAQPGSAAPTPAHAATVERGRIVSMSGIVALIWLAILVLMVWNS